MIRYILLLILPFLLHANLTYESNNKKDLALLKSFDVNASFIHDQRMNQMKQATLKKDDHFFQAIVNADDVIPTIKETLSKYKVPKEFLYLAMAESNFQMKAYSSKRAAGLWQFMPKTATKYGLKIDEYVDERRDLVKSTKAAATYLSFLHDMFGKWYLAAIAYNCGEGRLLDAIDKAGSDELAVLLDEEKKYIPLESRNYIRKIIALALIGSDEEYLMKSEYAYLLDRSDENGIATVKISSGESLSRISELLKMPLADLKELNGHLKYDFVPPYKGGYDIYIPHEKLADFKRKYTKESIAKIYKIHTVQAGDNLSKIGKKYGVSYHVIKDFNNLHSNRLKIKQKLIIPIPKKSKSHQLLSKNYYMVKRGDSLESIARRHHVSVQMIRQQNNLKGSFIKAGERLKIYE